MSSRYLALLSGGLDSSAMVLYAQAELGTVERSLFFEFAQSAMKPESTAALGVAKFAEIPIQSVDICSWREEFKGDVSMLKVQRNGILSLLAVPYAIAGGCNKILLGSTEDDRDTSDSNAEFITKLNQLLEVAEAEVLVEAPFVDLKWGKSEILNWLSTHLGDRCETFLEMTYSCFRSELCGNCSSCLERKKALEAFRAPTDV